jgi:hypothetical protein
MKHFRLILNLSGALSTTLFICGCSKPESEAVDYGPEVAQADILQAVQAPLAKSNAALIKVGEFVHFAETQEIAGGQVKKVSTDIGQTVVDRKEDDTQIVYTIVEHKVDYSSSEARKTSVDFPFVVKKVASTPSSTSPTPPTLSEISSSYVLPPYASPTDVSPLIFVKTMEEAKVSYHHLNVVKNLELPPNTTEGSPGCAGLIDCKINVHRISFDQVTWNNGTPVPVHFEFVMSPDAPFMAQILDKCVTMIVSISGSNSKTLVRQCKPVVSFRFE